LGISFTTTLITFDLSSQQNPFLRPISITAKMSYQNSSPQIQVGGTTGKAPISHWWVIGVFCSSVLFFVIGGGLLGAWSSSAACGYYYCYGDAGEWNGGIACIAIGAILKFVFWVLLIVWCVQRRRSRAPSTVVYVNAQAAAEAGTAPKPQPQANVYSAPQPEYAGVQPAPQYGAAAQVQAPAPVAEKQAVMRYCGHCGTGTTTPLCSQCGSQVPM
jgi:hypothetical protein